MNNTTKNLVRHALPFFIMAMSSMAMSQQVNGEEAKTVSPAHRNSVEKYDATKETLPAGSEQFRFCYQGSEMNSCEHAAPARVEANNEEAVSPPPMFDLDILLGGGGS